MNKFCIMGLGFVSDRHIPEIKKHGELVMACDLDAAKMYKSGDARFFVDWKKMVDSKHFEEVTHVSICTPNDMHYPMIKACLDKGKKVICEKPPIISMEEYEDLLKHPNFDDLRIVFQCRYKPLELKGAKKIDLVIDVYRDEWYMNSWKADKERSGGLVYNIGCHYIDLLVWKLGVPDEFSVLESRDRLVRGKMRFGETLVDWMISIEAKIDMQKRLVKIDDKTFNLTQMGFEALHGKVYDEIMAGRGHKLSIFEDTIKLIDKI